MSSVGLVLLTCEQTGNKDISSDVKREITQGLQERHGMNKGVVIAGTSCCFYDFETCKEIEESKSSVRVLV